VSDRLRLDLKKVPFSRKDASFLFFEEDNSNLLADQGRFHHSDAPLLSSSGDDAEAGYPLGLYITASSHHNTIRRKGLLEITPVKNGSPVEYTYTATPSILTINSGEGRIEIIFDSDNSVRIRGFDLGLKFFTKMNFMEGATTLPDGIVCLEIIGIAFVGGNFYFRNIIGGLKLDAVYNNASSSTESAIVSLTPDENGRFETAVFAMNPNEFELSDSKPFDESLEEITADFQAFCRRYTAPASETSELGKYLLWIAVQDADRSSKAPNLKESLIFNGRIRDVTAKLSQQPIHASAVSDPLAALDIMNAVFAHLTDGMLPTEVSRNKALFGAIAPSFGFGVMELLNKPGAAKLPKDKLKALYVRMKDHFEWWLAARSYSENTFAYAMPAECGLNASSYSQYDFPLETPDLYTWFIIYTQALARLAEILDPACDNIWQERSSALLESLVSRLWVGGEFVCRGTLTDRVFKSGCILARLPVILGEKLPRDILDKLISELSDPEKYLTEYGLCSESKTSAFFSAGQSGCGAVDMLLQVPFISGLRAAGAGEAADKAAACVIAGIEAFGFRDVISSDGNQQQRVPADYGDPIAASVLLSICGNTGKEQL